MLVFFQKVLDVHWNSTNIQSFKFIKKRGMNPGFESPQNNSVSNMNLKGKDKWHLLEM
jgi:hypothetical protein